MGGRVPLGYEKDERTLRINEAEAETVRTLYALYRKHGTLRQVKAEADRLRLRTKRRFAADGTRTGGLPFRRGHLHCLLTNPFAVGTALTGGPPHRSQRALLTHWAPTSGHDAQSLFGIRVQCSMLDDFHQPSVVDGIEESTDVRVEYPVLCQNSALLK